MIKEIIKKIEKQDMSIGGWILGFIGIVFIRFLLENLSSPSKSGAIVSDSETLIHYGLFYLVVLLGLSVIFYYFDNKNKNSIKLLLFGLMITWIPPVIDIITSGGKGLYMAYIFDSHKTLLYDFFTYFGPKNGITVGIRTEIFIILMTLSFYIWNKYKNVTKTILTFVTSYIFLFAILALPGTIFTVLEPFSTQSTSQFIEESISNSNISLNTLHPTLSYNTHLRFLEIGFDKFISQILFVLSFIIVFFFFWKTEREKLKVVLKNSRPERVLFYIFLLLIGIGYASMLGLVERITLFDFVGLFVLFISIFMAWMFAVHTNDNVDIDIDKISNKNRPLIENTLSETQMREISFIFLAGSLLGAFIVGYYQIFMMIVFTSAYYIYSTPPLRLKRIPLVSSMLISIACLSTMLSGFFFLSTNKTFSVFPPLVALGIILVFTLGTNVRDIKDIEGDKRAGIKTLPILFEDNGKKITGFLFGIGFLLLPIVFSFYTLYLLSIPASIVGYRLVVAKNYDERKIFKLYFVFFILTAILVYFLYWAKTRLV